MTQNNNQCTVNVAVLWKSLPAVFQAFTTILCVPAASVADPLRDPLLEEATSLLSMYAFMAEILAVPPLAAAEMATGELTVDPAAGLQIWTPAVVGALHAVELPTVKFTMV